MTRLTYADSILTEEDYQYLPPSVLPILEYEQELAEEGKYLTYEWANLEIKEHLMNWVRVGLVAHRMQYLKLWKGKFSSFRDYCENALGKKCFQIKNLIRSAELVLVLAREGYETLPSSVAQAMELINCCKKLEQDNHQGWLDAWEKITDELPPKLITAKSIKVTLGFASEYTPRNIRNDVYDKLSELARDEGLSFTDYLEKIIHDREMEQLEEVPELADDETGPVSPEAIELWETDLEQLVKEHDRQTWVQATLIKLAGLAKKVKSQFSFLVDHKLQLA